MLSAAAAEGKGIQALESALDRLAGWLRSGGEAEAIVPAVSQADDRGVDRLFRHLVPDVTGRRSGHEIIHRLRRKWDLDHSLSQILGRVRDQVHALAELRGPAQRRARAARPELRRAGASIDRRPARAGQPACGQHGVEPSRVELDLGFGRGIGFYSQMIFELVVATRPGRSRSAAAAVTTAWPGCWAATATTAASASRSGWNGSPRSPRGRPHGA